MTVELVGKIQSTLKNTDHPYMQGAWRPTFNEWNAVFANGDAEVIGTDPKTDLALIKIDGKDKKFDYVAFTKDEPRVGDWVIAVGNPFGLGGSVTTGISRCGMPS